MIEKEQKYFIKTSPLIFLLILDLLAIVFALVLFNWQMAFVLHWIFILLLGFIYFLKLLFNLIGLFLFPIFFPIFEIQRFRIKKFISKYPTYENPNVAIVLTHTDIRRVRTWLGVLTATIKELETMVQLLEVQKKTFTFYQRITFEELETIMENKKIKEVWFVGHGNSGGFELGTDIDLLDYRLFRDREKYAKQIIHQFHCGDKEEGALIDYIVPEANRSKCFLKKRVVTHWTVIKWLKKEIKEIEP